MATALDQSYLQMFVFQLNLEASLAKSLRLE